MKKVLALIGCTAGIFSVVLSARDYAAEIKTEAAHSKEDLKDAAYHAKEAAHSAKDALKEKAHDAATAVADKASELKENVQNKVEDATEVVAEHASAAQEAVSAKVEEATKTKSTDEMVEFAHEDTLTSLRLGAIVPGLEDNHIHLLSNANCFYHNGVVTIVIDKVEY